MDHQHRTLAGGNGFLEKSLQGFTGLWGAQAVQVDVILNRKLPFVQMSGNTFGNMQPDPFPVFGRVRHIKAFTGIDQSMQMRNRFAIGEVCRRRR